MIRPAKNFEANLLSEIAFSSKAYWGYDAAFMESCRKELTLTEAMVTSDFCYVIEDSNKLLGFYLLKALHNDHLEIDMFFIEPAFTGKGLGAKLFKHAVDLAKSKNFKYLEIQSDPFAQAFYEKMGAKVVEYTPSLSIPNRTLPLMLFAL